LPRNSWKSLHPQYLIELDALYPNSVDLTPLSVPFSEIEIHKALKSIPRDKSLAPDGFGSAFYQDFWSIIKPDIINTFS
jgi:hypothetical protein